VDLERKLYFVDWASLLRVSARTGRGVEKIWGLVDKVLAERSRRIPTAALNQWLGQATERTPPPPARGRSVKGRYATPPRSGSCPPAVRSPPATAATWSGTCGAPSGSRARRCGWWCGSGPGSGRQGREGRAGADRRAAPAARARARARR